MKSVKPQLLQKLEGMKLEGQKRYNKIYLFLDAKIRWSMLYAEVN